MSGGRKCQWQIFGNKDIKSELKMLRWLVMLQNNSNTSSVKPRYPYKIWRQFIKWTQKCYSKYVPMLTWHLDQRPAIFYFWWKQFDCLCVVKNLAVFLFLFMLYFFNISCWYLRQIYCSTWEVPFKKKNCGNNINCIMTTNSHQRKKKSRL